MDREREREIVRALAARRRTFGLPGIHELSKEAELAVRRGTGAGGGAVPEEGQVPENQAARRRRRGLWSSAAPEPARPSCACIAPAVIEG